MTPVDVLIPLGQGRRIVSGCLDWIYELPCVNAIHIEHDTEAYKSGDWIERLAGMRTRLLRKVRADFWLALDADVVMTADTLIHALDHLKQHPSWGGVGINVRTGETPEGITPAMACVLFRSQATGGLAFRRRDTPDSPFIGCECDLMGKDLRRRGWKYEYGDGLKAVHLGGVE